MIGANHLSAKVVFIDRDGVINLLVERNGSMVSPRLFKDFKICVGAAEGLTALRKAGYQTIVVTNQPDISRGLMLEIELEKMTVALYELGVNEVLVCPHSDEDSCECRKPKPGLLLNYLRTQSTKPTEIWMVGDRQVDIDAGDAVGARSILISDDEANILPARDRTKSLLAASYLIINQRIETPDESEL